DGIRYRNVTGVQTFALPISIGAVVAQATAEASRHAEHAAHAVGEAMRAVDFSGFGTKLSEESIKILGSGVVTGNPIKTVEFKSAGSARVQGPLEAETARIAGSCIFDSDVHVEEFRAAGSTRIAGNLKAEEIETSGSLQVAGSKAKKSSSRRPRRRSSRETRSASGPTAISTSSRRRSSSCTRRARSASAGPPRDSELCQTAIIVPQP